MGKPWHERPGPKSTTEDRFGTTRTRVLLAVVRQKHPTVRSVAAEVGRNITSTHYHLLELQRHGLIGWKGYGRKGSLHARVKPVSFGEDHG